VQRGDSVVLYVSTTAPTYAVELYRMGYYGGTGARLVWTSPAQNGQVQPEAVVTPDINMVHTSWAPSLTVRIDPSWPPGDYLFKLVSANGPQSYVPLTVRDDASHSALLIQNSVTTWQAYNLWGGYDLYEGAAGNGSTFADRSRVVSFDRPYRIGDGSGDFLGNEFPFVSLVESLGLDVSYETDVDLHEHPERLLQHKAFISLGHDEYWSTAMRVGVEAARDEGVNVAFLGANAVFRRIRLQPSPLGPDREEVNYKDGREDPLFGIDDANVTADWPSPPAARPESTLTGETYQCNPVKADFVVTKPSSWVFAGTGLTAGSKIKGLVGSEYDGYDPYAPGPKNVEIMAHSPLRCRGKPGYSDLTYYAAPSGAGVLDTGTNLWVPKLSDPTTATMVGQITENILTAFAAGPAGLRYPSVANYATLPKATYFPGFETPTSGLRGTTRSTIPTRPSRSSTTAGSSSPTSRATSTSTSGSSSETTGATSPPPSSTPTSDAPPSSPPSTAAGPSTTPATTTTSGTTSG
jgi:hypothetical protein